MKANEQVKPRGRKKKKKEKKEKEEEQVGSSSLFASLTSKSSWRSKCDKAKMAIN